LYYPSVKGVVSRKPQHHWFPRPLGVIAEGYARFAGVNNFVTNSIFTFVFWALVGDTTIPAEVDVPLHGTPLSVQWPGTAIDTISSDDQIPVMIFSHGYASSRTQYSQYFGELASRGHVIAAIEHRDGSGPGTLIMKKGFPARKKFTFSVKDLQ
jgi:platelet-activating factor acetylhydrolase